MNKPTENGLNLGLDFVHLNGILYTVMFLYWIGIYKMHTYIHIALIKTHHQDVKVNIEKIIQKGRINQTKNTYFL